MLCIVANNIALVATRRIPVRSLTEENVGDCAVVLPPKKQQDVASKPLGIPRQIAVVLAGKVANQTDNNIGTNNNPNVKDQGQNCNTDCHKQGNSGCDACA